MISLTTIIIWIAYFISLYFIIFWTLVFLEKDVKDSKNKKLKKFPLISIAVPAYNEETSIKKTVQSLLDLNYPKDKLELFVVDDGSKDKTASIVRGMINKNPEYSLTLINQQNQGKAAGLNNTLGKAKGDFFICLDADSQIEKNALQKMLPYFKNKDIGAVLPRIKTTSTSTLARKMQWAEYIITFFYKKLMGYVDCIHVTPGPFAMYRRSVLKKVGYYFDTNSLTEDMELALRIQKNNYKIIQTFDSIVYTKIPINFKEFYKQRNRWYKGALFDITKHRTLLFNKKYNEFGLMQVPMILISALISLSVFSIIFFYYILKPLVIKIQNYSFVNFNFWLVIRNYFSNFYILGLDFMKIFFIGIIFTIGLVFIFFAFKSTKIRVFEKGIIPPLTYITIYPVAIFIIWCGVIFDLVRKKKQKW